MKLKLILFLVTSSIYYSNAQDGMQLRINGTMTHHFHLNNNNVPVLEVTGDNTFIGSNAGEDHSSGLYNTYVGNRAGANSTTTHYNSNFGYNSGGLNFAGGYNSLFGASANYYNTHGSNNVCFGYQSNYRNQTGSNNTIIGYQAGRSTLNYSASGNVFLGYQAGYNETSSNRLYIDNSSTADPLIYAEFDNNELEINGDLTIDVPAGSSESRAEIKFNHENTNYYTIDFDSSNDNFEIRDGTVKLMVFNGFNIGIKRTPTTNDFEVNGTASKSSAGDWLANSDARLKKNIKPLNSSLVLSQLLKLQGITYEWNDHRKDQNRPEGPQYGFTAQNIQKVFPDLVSEDNDGYLQTAYGTYDAMYIEAIRALTEKIDVLENRIGELEQSISSNE